MFNQRDPMEDFLSRILSDFRDAGGNPETAAAAIKSCFDEWSAAKIKVLEDRLHMMSLNMSVLSDRQSGILP